LRSLSSRAASPDAPRRRRRLTLGGAVLRIEHDRRLGRVRAGTPLHLLLARQAGWREINEGLPGSTLTDVPGRAAPSGEARWRAIAARGIHPAVVVVMYGANDAVAGVPLGEPGAPGTFRNAAASVLRGLRAAFPRAALVVCTPQPGRRLQRSRAQYDAALADEARAVGAIVLSGEDAFAMEALPRYAADAIHLNDAGHAALAAHLERALLDAHIIAKPRVARALPAGGALIPTTDRRP
jgi:lysophospholipase L1-like esterase